MVKSDDGVRISAKFDRSASVLSMLEWLAGKGFRVLPIQRGTLTHYGKAECAFPQQIRSRRQYFKVSAPNNPAPGLKLEAIR